MKGKLPNQNQRNLFWTILKEIVNPEHELVILAHHIDWNEIGTDFRTSGKISGIKIKNAIVDRGYKGKTKVNQTIIVSPKPPE